MLGFVARPLAQDLEPRSYSNIPIGLNFLVNGYGNSRGGLGTDPALPIENAELEMHTTLIGYARSIAIAGHSAKFDAIVPYSWLSGTADVSGVAQSRKVNGFNDPKLRLSVNLYGAPALSLKDFAGYRQDLIIGASFQLTPPLGQYDDQRLINLGTNRWAFKPELGMSKALARWIWELSTGATLFSENDDFFKGHEREQNAMYSVQSHLIYSFGSGLWMGIDGTWYTGGRTTIDGVLKDDLLRNVRLGLTLAVPVNPAFSIKFYGSTGVVTHRGANFDVIGVVWQYRWSDGQ